MLLIISMKRFQPYSSNDFDYYRMVIPDSHPIRNHANDKSNPNEMRIPNLIGGVSVCSKCKIS